jgi:hypothetical protein
LFHTGGTPGVRPSEGFPSDRRDASRHPLPLLAVRLSTVATLGVVTNIPALTGGGPSLLRICVATRRPVPAPDPDRSGERLRRRARGRSRWRACLQGFQPVSEVRTPVGGCYPARWEPILSWDFQPSRGLPLPALTRPLAENASIFGSCDRVSPRALRVGVRTGRSRTLQGLDRRGGRLVSLETTAPPGVPVLVLGAGGG